MKNMNKENSRKYVLAHYRYSGSQARLKFSTIACCETLGRDAHGRTVCQGTLTVVRRRSG